MSRIGRYAPEGVAEPRAVRTAAAIDLAAAVLLAILAFPFPIARASLSTPEFVVSILVTIVVVHVSYLVLCVVFLGQTPGMFLLDLGLDPRPERAGLALAWAVGWCLAIWPALFGSSLGDPLVGLPARLSGLETVSTRIEPLR